jgi:hypothetical protein
MDAGTQALMPSTRHFGDPLTVVPPNTESVDEHLDTDAGDKEIA